MTNQHSTRDSLVSPGSEAAVAVVVFLVCISASVMLVLTAALGRLPW